MTLQSTSESSPHTLDQQESMLAQRVGELRQKYNLSLQQLAEASDLSVGTLSQVERGMSQPSLRTVRKLANAFGLPTAYFFDATEWSKESDGIVIRNGQGAKMTFGDTDMQVNLLTQPDLDGLQVMLVHLQPGAMSGAHFYEHSGLDAGYILSGTMNLEVEDKIYVLTAGDSFSFDSQRPHRFENRGTKEAVLIYVNTQAADSHLQHPIRTSGKTSLSRKS